MLKVTDLLLQSNGFGMIVLDLGDIPVQSARQIPLASWFRFRRAIENTPTVLLVLEQQPIAGSCSSVLLKVSGVRCQISANRLAHTELLDQFEIRAELIRSRIERKPAQSATSFSSRATWAG
jgi:recombination protein RecA